MARYRKVDPRIWNDAKFRQLSDDSKLVFFFLLTHPHQTALGAMRGTMEGLAGELQWSHKGFRKAFQEASGKGMVKADESASMIWLPKFLRYNGPESPNVVKAWESALDLIPECPLKAEAIQAAKDYLQGLSKAYLEAFPEAFDEALAQASLNPEPEQEPEQENTYAAPEVQDERSYTTKKGRKLKPPHLDRFERFWTAFNYRKGKAEAADAWLDLKPDEELAEEIISGAEAEANKRPSLIQSGYTPKMAQGWLTGRRWEDEDFTVTQKPADGPQRKKLD